MNEIPEELDGQAAEDGDARARDRRNREFWNARSDAYQHDHGAQFALQVDEPRWGVWSIPDSELGVLDDVTGKAVLELGCGAAHSSIALARRGARPVGLDISERQLEHAHKLVGDAGAPVTLVHASAESIPFRAASFDMVFSDHGAIALADPERTLAEAARVLRGRGLLAFLVPSPFTALCWNRQTGRLGSILQRAYFDIGADDGGTASSHQRTYGDWVRLFRGVGLTVEDLIEVRPPEDATTSFPGFASLEWARRFPAEIIWRVRKGPVRRRK